MWFCMSMEFVPSLEYEAFPLETPREQQYWFDHYDHLMMKMKTKKKKSGLVGRDIVFSQKKMSSILQRVFVHVSQVQMWFCSTLNLKIPCHFKL